MSSKTGILKPSGGFGKNGYPKKNRMNWEKLWFPFLDVMNSQDITAYNLRSLILLHTRFLKIIKHPEQKSTFLIINVNLKEKKKSVSSSRINLQYKICIEKSRLFQSAPFYCLMGEKLNDAENITSTWCIEVRKAVESWGRGFRSRQLLSSLERSHQGLLSPRNRASGRFDPDAVSIRGPFKKGSRSLMKLRPQL